MPVVSRGLGLRYQDVLRKRRGRKCGFGGLEETRGSHCGINLNGKLKTNVFLDLSPS